MKLNNIEELQQAYQDNLGFGLTFLVEDFHMQVVNIFISTEDEELWGMYPYPNEEGDAMKIKASSLVYPIEVLYTDKDNFA